MAFLQFQQLPFVFGYRPWVVYVWHGCIMPLMNWIGIIFQNSLGLSDQDRTMLRLLSEHLKRGQRSQDSGG